MSETKQRLLDTAIELIWEHSYGSVSVDDICKKSNVKKGSFYHFFPSKSDLAVAAYEEHWIRNQPHYDALFAPEKPPATRIADWCDMIYRKQKEMFDIKGHVLGCPYASVGSELCTQDEKVRLKTVDLFHRKLVYIENTLAEGIKDGAFPSQNPKSAAQEICAYVMGVLVNARVQNNPEIIARDLRNGVFRLIGITNDRKAA